MNLNRRSLLKFAAASSTATFSPLGVFFGSRASASVPTGPYLNRVQEDRFWFQTILENEIKDGDPSKEYWLSSDGQLSARLGVSGGFAIGYFSTLSFLSDYRDRFPNHYKDLLFNISQLPAENRISGLRKRLQEHRVFAGSFPAGRDTLGLRVAADTLDAATMATTLIDYDDGAPRLFKNPSTMFTVSDFSPGDVETTFISAAQSISDASRRRFENFSVLSERTDEIETLSDAQAKVRTAVDAAFWSENDRFITDRAFLDTDRLTKPDSDFPDRLYIDRQDVTLPDGSAAKKGFVEPLALTLTVEKGVEQGQIAAVSFFALLEARRILGDVDVPGAPEPESEIDSKDIAARDRGLLAYAEAQSLLQAFTEIDTWNFGMGHAAFRPAVRLCNTCTFRMPNGAITKLDFETPFLPMEFANTLNDTQKMELEESNATISAAATEALYGQLPSSIEPPKSTRALPEAAFACCPSVRRHTLRLLSQVRPDAPDLAEAELQDIVLTPTITAPWVFAGMGAALVKTRLQWSNNNNNISTPVERSEFRKQVDKSIWELLNRSVDPKEPGSLATSSANNPAMAQYASGYTVAWTLADNIADNSAMAAGASAVYTSLHQAMPEKFPSISDTFTGLTTANDIAQAVLVVARSIDAELKSLRIQVNNLTQTVKELTDFVADLDKLIRSLEGKAAGVSDKQALLDFQAHANELIDAKMVDSMETYQLSALRSVQGLVNTFVTSSIQVVSSIQAEARINAQVCSPGGVQK